MPAGSSASEAMSRRSTSAGSASLRGAALTSGVMALRRALSSKRPAKTGVTHRSEGAALMPAAAPAITTATSMR